MNNRCILTGRFKKSRYFDYVGGDIESQGVYQITNKLNGKIYIGSCYSNTFKRRWFKHIERLNKNLHGNKHLQSAWNKYGEFSFVFTIKEYLEKDKKLIHKREQFYLDTEVIFKYDYNLKEIAKGGGVCIFNEKECLEIVNDYISNDLNLTELGIKYNSSKQTVNKITNGLYYNCRNIDKDLIKKCKIKSKRSIFNASKKTNIKNRALSSTQALEVFKKFTIENVSAKELALKYNTNTSTIRDIGKKRTYKNIHTQKYKK